MPAPARRALFLSVSAAAAIALVAWLKPLAMGVAAASAIGLVLIRWSWRTARHRLAGLPPGGPARGWSLITDPDHYRKRWRRLGPVFTTGFAGRPQVCIFGLERGATLLADERSIGRDELDYDRLAPGGIARRMDGEQARYYRPLLNGAFRPAVGKANEDVLIGHIVRGVDELAAVGGTAGVDPLPGIERMLTAAWLELFFGLDPDNPAAGAIADDLGVLARYRHRARHDSESAVARIETLIAEHAREFDGRWAFPNALSTILAREPSAVDDPTLMRNLILLVETTRHDVGGLLMWLTKHNRRPPSMAGSGAGRRRGRGCAGVGDPSDGAERVLEPGGRCRDNRRWSHHSGPLSGPGSGGREPSRSGRLREPGRVPARAVHRPTLQPERVLTVRRQRPHLRR